MCQNKISSHVTHNLNHSILCQYVKAEKKKIKLIFQPQLISHVHQSDIKSCEHRLSHQFQNSNYLLLPSISVMSEISSLLSDKVTLYVRKISIRYRIKAFVEELFKAVRTRKIGRDIKINLIIVSIRATYKREKTHIEHISNAEIEKLWAQKEKERKLMVDFLIANFYFTLQTQSSVCIDLG